MLEEMLEQLRARGVRFRPGQDIAEWAGEGALLLRDVQTGEEHEVSEIDTVVGAVGSRPENRLAALLRGRIPEIHVIGDANLPQTCEQATFQGARIGRLL